MGDDGKAGAGFKQFHAKHGFMVTGFRESHGPGPALEGFNGSNRPCGATGSIIPTHRFSIQRFIQVGCTCGLLHGAAGIRGHGAVACELEFSFYFGDADKEAALDLGDGLGLAEMAGGVEVLQVGTQLVEELAGKAVAHG